MGTTYFRLVTTRKNKGYHVFLPQVVRTEAKN